MSFGKFRDPKEGTPEPSNDDSGRVRSLLKTQDPNSPKMQAFLGRGSKVVGALTFEGPVELDGDVEGEVTSKDQLTIGESAVINAKVMGSEILVRGTVNGDIVASKRLSLRKPAKVRGNITSANLSIEEGVVFEGNCIMNSSSDGKISKVPSKGPVGAIA